MKRKLFVGLLAFFIPPLAFLYLSQKWLALLYFTALCVAGLGGVILDKHQELYGLELILSRVALVHAITLAGQSATQVKKRFYNHWWGVLAIPVVVMVILFALRVFVFEFFRIPTSAMAPNVKPGDYILATKWGYGTYGAFGIDVINLDNPRVKPKPGEMIVFHSPLRQATYLSRIIGSAGDHVVLSENQLSINGQQVSKPKTIALGADTIETVGQETYTAQYLGTRHHNQSHDVTVPEGYYFVLSDNRNNAQDSRVYGLVSQGNIIGKVLLAW